MNFLFQEFVVSKNAIFNAAQDTCDILKYEFLLSKPCQKMNDLFEESFERLKLQGILALPEATNTNHPVMSKAFLQDIDDDSEDEVFGIDHNDTPNIRFTEIGHEKRIVLMSCVGPFLHTYLAVAKSLYSLVESNMMESGFVMACVKEITSKVESFECKFGKSLLFSFL